MCGLPVGCIPVNMRLLLILAMVAAFMVVSKHMSHKIPSLDEILALSDVTSYNDRAMVRKAYEFSHKAHRGQKRNSGAPYFQHPAIVATYIAELGLGASAITASLLHDVVEDTGITFEQIQNEFGSEVAMLVDSVTKLSSVRYRGLERHAESLRKLFAATASDIRVLIIKLMDRLHNARTLEYVPQQKRKRIALETLEIYAPIAFRLGMGTLQKDLEDAAFPHAFPKEYALTKALITEKTKAAEKRLERAERDIKRELGEAGIRNFRIQARVKGLYSFYKKLMRKDQDSSQIHDTIALRLIVETVDDCYRVFGIAHKLWTPLPGRIKDYISSPKLNGYQSIHTTVHTGDDGLLEVQIRTEAMHREAQFGLAAHMEYKTSQGAQSGSGALNWIWQFFRKQPETKHKEYAAPRYESREAGTSETPQNAPHWVQLLAEARDAEGNEEYLRDLKEDFFSHRIFAFTPHGDVIDLPIGATPVDFAYAIHSDLGEHTTSAKINGKLVALSTHIENGDTVDIESKQTAHPSAKWLDFVKTSLAKRKIRSYLTEHKKDL